MKKVMWCFMYSKKKTEENYKEACELWRERERNPTTRIYVGVNLLLNQKN